MTDRQTERQIATRLLIFTHTSRCEWGVIWLHDTKDFQCSKDVLYQLLDISMWWTGSCLDFPDSYCWWYFKVLHSHFLAGCLFCLVHLSSVLFSGKRLALCYSVVVLSANPLKLLLHVVPSVRLCTRKAGGMCDYDHYDCSSLNTVSQAAVPVNQSTMFLICSCFLEQCQVGCQVGWCHVWIW